MLAALALSGCASLTAFFDAQKEKHQTATGPVAATEAAPVRLVAAYTLEIEAPSDLRKLLQEHLDLARFQRTAEADRLNSVELDRLSSTTPAQAKSLLETEGYFNSHVTLSRKPASAGAAEEIRVAVDPGPRTQVSA